MAQKLGLIYEYQIKDYVFNSLIFFALLAYLIIHIGLKKKFELSIYFQDFFKLVGNSQHLATPLIIFTI